MISLAENCGHPSRGTGWVLVTYDGVNAAWINLDEPTTEPSVLQEHANLIAKLDEASDGWWGDFGHTPASDRNGIANEAMRQAMTQTQAGPQPKPQAPDGVFEVAPMGRNPRGWGI